MSRTSSRSTRTAPTRKSSASDTTAQRDAAALGAWRWRAAPRANGELLLALQGGGAHGAYTWGVLDALLEDTRIPLMGASGASAGALNAAVLAQGLLAGGATPALLRSGSTQAPSAQRARESARGALARFWEAVAQAAPFEQHGHWLLQGDPKSPRLSIWALWMLDWSSRFAPQQVNPLNVHPLRDLLSAQVDFAGLRAHSPLPLFLSATRVRTGEPRIFREQELSLDVLLASTCLPRLHHPVVIEGEAYWDGGFSANPPLAPLVFEAVPAPQGRREILLVTLTRQDVTNVPNTPREIAQRQTELAFQAPLASELRWLAATREEALAAEPQLPWHRTALQRRLLDTQIHTLALDASPPEPDAISAAPDGALIASLSHLQALRDAGRAAAQAWLAARAAQ